MVTRQNGYHGTKYRATRRTSQEGLTSPTMFNVVVEHVVPYCLSMTLEEDTVVHDGLGHAVWRIIVVFYAENGIIGSWFLEWIQGSLNIFIGLFCQIGLVDNFVDSKTMTCQLGSIWSVISEEAVGQISTVIGDNYRERLWLYLSQTLEWIWKSWFRPIVGACVEHNRWSTETCYRSVRQITSPICLNSVSTRSWLSPNAPFQGALGRISNRET